MSTPQHDPSPDHFERLPPDAQARAKAALRFVCADLRLQTGTYKPGLLGLLAERARARDVPAEHVDLLLEWLLAGGRGLAIVEKDARAQAKKAGCSYDYSSGLLRCRRCKQLFERVPCPHCVARLEVDRGRLDEALSLKPPPGPAPEGHGAQQGLDARAVGVFLTHPDWTKKEIARELDRDASALRPERCPMLHAAMAARRNAQAPPHGMKTAGGDMEATDDGD